MPRRRWTAPARAGRSTGHLLRAWLALSGLVLLGRPGAAEDPVGFDPVRRLRQALQATPDLPDLQARRQSLEQCTAALCSPPDLQEALLLHGWRDEDLDESLAAVDRAVRSELARRFERVIREVLRHGDPAGQAAAANMLSESGLALRNLRLPGWEPGALSGVLAELVRGNDPGVRAAAARALGHIHADPVAAISAFQSLCQDRDPGRRRAGMSGLIHLVRGIENAPPRPTDAARDGPSPENLAVLRTVVPVASAGLADPDAEVRRLSMEALRLTALATAALVAPPPALPAASGDDAAALRHQAEAERTELEPLAWELKELAVNLIPFLGDRNPAGRLLAHQTVEALNTAWCRLEDRAGDCRPPGPNAKPGGVAQAQAREARPVSRSPALVPVLAWGASDPDVQIRRTAVETLELLGGEATPAAHALVCALGDRDVFVRWTAARALGRIGPVPRLAVVPGLVALLGDPDLDVRLAAAEALGAIGPAAQEAVPALGRAVAAGTPALRLACMDALESIGLPAQPAIPALATALRVPNVRVRLAAARLLGKFGPAALEAKEALQAALRDPDADVRQTVSDALLHILPPPGQSTATIGSAGEVQVVPASFASPGRRQTLFAEDR